MVPAGGKRLSVGAPPGASRTAGAPVPARSLTRASETGANGAGEPGVRQATITTAAANGSSPPASRRPVNVGRLTRLNPAAGGGSGSTGGNGTNPDITHLPTTKIQYRLDEPSRGKVVILALAQC